jgi:hypothetical protein
VCIPSFHFFHFLFWLQFNCPGGWGGGGLINKGIQLTFVYLYLNNLYLQDRDNKQTKTLYHLTILFHLFFLDYCLFQTPKSFQPQYNFVKMAWGNKLLRKFISSVSVLVFFRQVENVIYFKSFLDSKQIEGTM